MVLNYIWIAFFIIAFIVAICRFCYSYYQEANQEVVGTAQAAIDQNRGVFSDIVNSIFERAELGFTLSLGLTGILALWLGIMKIGEKGGAIKALSYLVAPLFRSIFPAIPKNHPASGSIVMNFCANMLGLDNAATPLGLKAMDELQELNPKKDTASNEQIMFLVLNTSGLTLIPVSIMALRASAGAGNPSDIFLPILFATFCSSLVGLITVSIIQKINLFKPVVLAYILGATALIAGFGYYLSGLNPDQMSEVASIVSSTMIFGIIIGFITLAVVSKVNIYEAFIEGAKDGFKVAIKIVPFLIAMLVAIGAFTSSGAMGYLVEGLATIFAAFGMDTAFVESLPTAIMKPLSGGGARGMMVESWGEGASQVDSFTGRLTSILQGSTETTFYVLAVYFGSVGIKKTRYAVKAGLIADLAGIIAAICMGYFFFGSSVNQMAGDQVAKNFFLNYQGIAAETLNKIKFEDHTQTQYPVGQYLQMKQTNNGTFFIDTVYYLQDKEGFIVETNYTDERAFYTDGVKEKYLLDIKNGSIKSITYYGNIKLEEKISNSTTK